MPAVLSAVLPDGLAGLWQSQRCSPESGAREPRVGPPVTRHPSQISMARPQAVTLDVQPSRCGSGPEPRSVERTMVKT